MRIQAYVMRAGISCQRGARSPFRRYVDRERVIREGEFFYPTRLIRRADSPRDICAGGLRVIDVAG